MRHAGNATAALQLLGQFRLALAGDQGEALAVNAPRHRALLAYLALHTEGVSRDQIAELLWGEKPDRHARQSLRQAILSIRKDLESSNLDLLETGRETIRLNLSKVRVDVHDFLRRANSNSPFSLGLAAEIYKGDLFGNFSLGLETFDSWLVAARDQLRLKATEIFEHQISYLNSEGHHAEALAAADRLVSLDPANEASQRLLIQQIATHRGRIAAIEHATVFAEHVKSNYGAKLEGETLRLIASLRATSPARSALGERPSSSDTSDKSPPFQPRLEDERKLISVLVATIDMKPGSDPEDEWRRLYPEFGRLSEAVREYGGIVSQVTDNGIVALFGAPEAREDHAVSACFAALRIRDSQSASPQAESNTAAIRIAISSGEVVMRAVANDLQVDYTAIGETSRIARQLEQIAPAGRVLVSQATTKLASGFVRVRPFAAIDGAARHLPAGIHELTGVVANGSRLLGAANRGLTPFVGRAAELNQLRIALAQAKAGRGKVIAIAGEPGIGKSRICAEFISSGLLTDCRVMQGSPAAFGPARPLLPFIEMLRAYFGIRDSDEIGAVRLKVQNGVMTLGSDIVRLLPSLLSLLDIPVENAEWQQLAPAKRRRQTLDDLAQFLLRLCRRRCLAIVIENLHWIDGESDLLLQRLVEETTARSLLLVLTYRPQYTNRWPGLPHCHEIRLEPFSATVAGDLLTRLLGDHPSLAPLLDPLLKQTDGNPLFLEESVRSLIETGQLIGKRGAYRVGQKASTAHLPATVQGLLAERIDRLSKDDKRLLQTAAVIGRELRVALLAHVTEMSRAELQEGLRRLEAADFLHAIPSGEPTYKFKHWFTHDVAYRGILQNRRRNLHARITSALESLYAERLDEHVEQLGYHALNGELWAQAFDYLRRAGLNAFNRSQNREARRLFEMSLAALAKLPKTRMNSERAIDIRLEMRAPILSLADQAGAEQILVEARNIAADLADSYRLGRVMANLSSLYMTKADLENGAALGAEAVAQGDLANRAVGLPAMASNLQSMGRHAEAITLFRETIALTSGPLLHERFGQLLAPSVFGHAGLAIGLAETGSFEEALDIGERGVRIAESRRLPAGNLGYALTGLGRALLRRGDFIKASETLERGLDVCLDFEIPFYEVVIAPQLAGAYLLAGDFKRAITLLERTKEISERMSMRNAYPLIIGALGEALFEMGRVERTNALLNEALDMTRSQEQRGFEAGMLKLMGDIAGRSADPALAERRYKEGLSIATECGMRPLAAHCHLGLGELYRDIGGPSCDHLHLAIDSYRTMGMTWWLERAQASPSKGEGHSSTSA